MKPQGPSELGLSLSRFFREYLPSSRGMSQHTLRAYRDTIVLFLRFLCTQGGRRIEELTLDVFTSEQVSGFLMFLEQERHNSIATRNARLAALHTLARFLACDHPQHLAELQRILGLPFKRGARQAPVDYLEPAEVKAILDQIDRSTALGQRDYALFALMFNTGARVQEILDLRRCDLRTEPPCQVRLHGKGGKIRVCPIWPQTAQLLVGLQRHSPVPDDPNAVVFVNRQGGKLTRFGVRYLLDKYVHASTAVIDSLRGKRLHPHSIRHTTAIALLHAGVDFATLSQWLGHTNLNTTMVYARVDLDLKRQALAQVFPEVLPTPSIGHLAIPSGDLVDWLKRL